MNFENIESGRKADLSLGKFLSIAYALRVPPSLLLAPLVHPTMHLDLPNISDDLRDLTATEFDAWFSGVASGGHRPTSAAERKDREDLEALRELASVVHEINRLQRMLGHASAAMTLDTYSELFDDDLDIVAVRLDEAASRVLSALG